MSTDAGGVSASNDGLGVLRDRPKYVLYDKSETVAQSVASDAATFGGLMLCIWFSGAMGGGVWEFVSVVMFALWSLCKLPWERVTRTTKLRTKADAMAWAQGLPEDA